MNRQDRHLSEFGPFLVDSHERLLYRDGEVVPLTAKVFDTLLVFLQNSGRTVEKEELMQQIWPGQFVEEGNLTRNVSTLRKALGVSPDDHRYIVTIPGYGYRFVAEVKEVKIENGNADSRPDVAAEIAEAEDNSAEVIEAASDQIAPMKIAVTNAAMINKGRAASGLRSALLILIVIAAATVVYASFIRERYQPPRPIITSLAVLPLENLSGDPSREYFADGMTDALIGDLAKIGSFRVISRTSVMHYKGTKKALPEIARELKVDAVVEGTIQGSGDRICIRAQLIHAATDGHLWSETYERELRDLLRVQSEVAKAIAREIQGKITPGEKCVGC